MTRVLGIVPARAGSKRVPGKNRRLLGGKPLALWALEAATAARSLTCVALSSDDDQILALATPGIEVLRRPAELATDTALAIRYVTHALAELATRGHDAYDAVAIIQPSSPFTLPEDIDGTVELLFRSGADSAVSVQKIAQEIHPLKLKRMEGDRLLPYLEEERGRMAAHELPDVYVRNGSVYASLVRTIQGGSVLGEDSRGYLMPRERSIDINDEIDFAFAELLLARRP